MSMTKEEAVYWLENGWKHSFEGKYREVYDLVLSALRPITREQVENVWKGEWIDCSNGWMCSRCEHDNTYAKPFCPNCGAPMTDEAVDMVMERLEAVKDAAD